MDRGGAPLPGRIASEFGAALGHRFDHVRVHADEPAAQAAERIGARAFTHGDRIGFARGEYRPDTSAGRWLLAHELTHVAQQQHAKAGGASAAGPVPASSVIQRQPPADAPAAPALLTEAEITAAIAYNQARFSDPWTIATIRELIGIDKYPAVSDRDLALGVAAWQDSHPPLVVDGKIGVGTTRTITDALAAAGSNALRQQVRADHTVDRVGRQPGRQERPITGRLGCLHAERVAEHDAPPRLDHPGAAEHVERDTSVAVSPTPTPPRCITGRRGGSPMQAPSGSQRPSRRRRRMRHRRSRTTSGSVDSLRARGATSR